MSEGVKDRGHIIFLIIAVPLALLVGAAWLAYSAAAYPFKVLYGEWLKHRFWRRHGRFGRFVLFVYSDSPNWKAYVESNILPRVEGHAVTLNWSRRREWEQTFPFEARVFRRWAGEREFNPLALIIRPGRPVQVLRFWKAFKDFKHGRGGALTEAQGALLGAVERYRARRASRNT